MRQSLVQRLNCGIAELQDKEYSVCGIRTAELKVTAYSLCGSGPVEFQVIENSVCGSGTSSHIIFWFLMQWPEWHENAGATGPWVKAVLDVLLFTFPSWRWPLLGCFVCLLRYYEAVTTQLTHDKDPDIRQTSWPKAAGTKLPTGSTRYSKSRTSIWPDYQWCDMKSVPYFCSANSS